MTDREPDLPPWAARLADFVQRRLDGDYQVDEFGFDPEFNSAVVMPLALALYRQWFRVKTRGLQNVPDSGAALVVANHSGVLPLDALMLQAGVHAEHPAHRHVRLLSADLVWSLPVLAGVFPEGFKGIGKPFSERYQLQRFGRGGFAHTALRAGAPIIPCAIVGAEEIYPMIGNSATLARHLRLPYFPVTPLFPWLGPIGAIPLPSNWIIEFCDPVETAGYAAAERSDPCVIAALADEVRNTIQDKIDKLLAERGPAFG